MKLLERREEVKKSDEELIYNLADQVKKTWEETWKNAIKTRLEIDSSIATKSMYARLRVAVSACHDISKWEELDNFYLKVYLKCNPRHLLALLDRVPDAVESALKIGTKHYFEDATKIAIERDDIMAKIPILGIDFYVVSISASGAEVPKETAETEPG